MSRSRRALGVVVLALCGVWSSCGGGSDVAGWQPVDALQDQHWWMNVTASPDGSRWVTVGGRRERGELLEGEAAGRWSAAELPDVPLLNWAQLFDDGTGFAVGNRGTVLHYDGSRWREQSTPTDEDLWGVWGADPDDVWAVGGAGRSADQATLLHYDGEQWRDVALPALERPNVWALFKVWGSAADDVWVVGQHGVLLHYDGSSWSEHGAGTGEDLIALWGVGPDRIVAVGGRSSGVVAVYDGQRWRSQSLAPLPGLSGVWTGDGETVFVSGIEGTLAELDFDSLEYIEDYQDTSATFHALHGNGTRVLSVGGNLDASGPPYQGVARERTWRSGER